MRLFAHADRLGMPRVGILVDGKLITGGQLAKFEPKGEPWSQTVFFPGDQVIVPGWREALEETLRRARKGKATRRDPDSRRPLPAVWMPEKIVGIGLNYADHAREGGREVPKRPLMFAKFANTIVADGESIVIPPGTHALDQEVELGVVIGRRTRRIAPEEAMDHVAGYVVVNDVSARDWQGNPQALAEGQKGDGQWLRAKGSDTFLPVGPVLVTPDEVDPAAGLRLRSWILRDGEEILMQDGNTRDLLVDVPHLVSMVSQEITLEPGDLIITGTPAGVGVFRDPPVFLRPGDRVRCEVEGVGRVENLIVDWTEDPRRGI